jgi:hypothetical protein
MIEWFYLPLLPFVAVPWLALGPAAVFGYGWHRRRRTGAGGVMLPVAAAIWAAYAIYEVFMQRWSASVIAPIRIDLLAIAPLLYAVAAAAVVALSRPCRAPPRAGGPERTA